MNVATAIVLDDEPYAIKRLEQLLNQFDQLQCVGTFQEIHAAEDFVLKEQVDLIFLDIEMPDKSGLEMANTFKQITPRSKIVFTTSHDHYAVKAIRSGAFDYLLKPIDIDDLKQCLTRFITEQKIDLTDREIEIVRLLARGMKSQDIGHTLYISKHTVDTHRRRILQKTDCKNTAELIQFAVTHQLV